MAHHWAEADPSDPWRPEPRNTAGGSRPVATAPTEEPGNPERIPARTQQRIELAGKLRQSKTKRDTKVALRGQM